MLLIDLNYIFLATTGQKRHPPNGGMDYVIRQRGLIWSSLRPAAPQVDMEHPPMADIERYVAGKKEIISYKFISSLQRKISRQPDVPGGSRHQDLE